MLMLAAGMAAGQTNDVHFDVLRTVDGHAYTNATITRTTTIFAIVDFDGGGAKIAFTNLPANIQRQFRFDPAKAQAELDLQALRKQEAKNKLEAQIKAKQDAEKDRLFRIVEDKAVSISKFGYLHGKVSQVMTNGVLLLLYDRIAEKHKYQGGGLTAAQSIGAYVGPGVGGGSYTTYSDVLGDKTVFINCPVRGAAEGQDWTVRCLHNGTFSFSEPGGTPRIIEKYDTGVSSVTKSDAFER